MAKSKKSAKKKPAKRATRAVTSRKPAANKPAPKKATPKKPAPEKIARARAERAVAKDDLRAGIATLGRIMAEARRDLAALQANDMRLRDLPGATDELSAVVSATESATNSILDAVEGIEKVAGTLAPEAGDPIRDGVTRIYEACNFQDLTGQRISKVVNVLREVDRTVLGLMDAFGIALDPATARALASAPPKAKGGEADLLNGPQMPGAGQDQASIDALFDKA
jgi:chemotaxis protein CheZ